MKNLFVCVLPFIPGLGLEKLLENRPWTHLDCTAGLIILEVHNEFVKVKIKLNVTQVTFFLLVFIQLLLLLLLPSSIL